MGKFLMDTFLVIYVRMMMDELGQNVVRQIRGASI